MFILFDIYIYYRGQIQLLANTTENLTHEGLIIVTETSSKLILNSIIETKSTLRTVCSDLLISMLIVEENYTNFQLIKR